MEVLGIAAMITAVVILLIVLTRRRRRRDPFDKWRRKGWDDWSR